MKHPSYVMVSWRRKLHCISVLSRRSWFQSLQLNPRVKIKTSGVNWPRPPAHCWSKFTQKAAWRPTFAKASESELVLDTHSIGLSLNQTHQTWHLQAKHRMLLRRMKWVQIQPRLQSLYRLHKTQITRASPPHLPKPILCFTSGLQTFYQPP